MAEYLEEGRLQLHGWYYDIGTGEVLCYHDDSDSFLPAAECYKDLV